MKYLTGTTKHDLPDLFGFMATPHKGITTLSQDPTGKRVWAVDNGAFSGKFDEVKFFRFIEKMTPYLSTNLFCACPDKMLDPLETLNLYNKYYKKIKDLGYNVAFIAQDGQEKLPFPSDFDWLFIGGSTDWKLGIGAVSCILRAKDLGKRVHIGRVNSYKRWKHFAVYGIDSVDGNRIKYEPTKNIQDVLHWYYKLEMDGLV